MFEHVPDRIGVPSVDGFDRNGVEVVELPLGREWDGPGRLTGWAARGQDTGRRAGGARATKAAKEQMLHENRSIHRLRARG